VVVAYATIRGYFFCCLFYGKYKKCFLALTFLIFSVFLYIIMIRIKEGFTLIELMVVIVIIGILAAIAIPNYVKIVDQAKVAEVKANMHTVQLEVEYYCIEEASHRYPSSIDLFADDLPSGMNNPFIPGGTVVQDESGADIPGVVEYATEDPNDSYSIIGLGKQATVIHLILSPGRVD